ncbi:MAG: flippase-like domain-containing protein [Nocardioidaceae bacterium]|nr:flippase-like domain-containing protein [Nocardioidaceae bacterium]
MLHSRALLVLGIVVAAAVPVATLPRLPEVSPWPVLAGLVPWIVGKYVLCPLRWRVLTTGAGAPQACGWYLRANAESEVFGLLTPGHVGADVWRTKRLTGTGLCAGDALLSVGMDRLVGAVGLAAFAVFGASELPLRLLMSAAGLGLLVLAAAVVVRRTRPGLLPRGPLPPPRALVLGLLLAAGYQLTIAGLLLGTIAATGNTLSPLEILAAFGASQVAAAVPGPNGASPRDGALVVALVALGVPLVAAAAAVTLRATLAWLPALTLGGLSLWLLRRQAAGPLSKVSVAAS